MNALIHRIRYFLFNKKLSALIPGAVTREMINLTKAKSIGIVYDATDIVSDHAVNDFAEYLRKSNKEVDVIGYIGNAKKDQVVEEYKFTNRDIAWNYIPQTPIVDQFVAKAFDILICLNTAPSAPLEYIAAMSHARFRVGKYFPSQEKYFEWMINDEEGRDIDYLIRQVRTFLSKLKTA